MKVTSENENSFEVSVVPHELIGFKDLMNVVLEVENKEVREDAASFICQMYCHLSPDLTGQKEKIVTDFVHSLLESIKTSF